MSAIKFSCPDCGQHIECGPEYAGAQVNCPTCQKAMIVPGLAPAAFAPPQPAGVTCPGCGVALSEGTVICTSCGMNLRTGNRIQPQVTSPLPGRVPAPASGRYNTKMIATVLLVVLGALFGLGFTNPKIALAFHVVQAIYGLIVGILVIVTAFRESAGQGFMTMCIPCYALYFVYSVCDSALIKLLFSIAILTRLAAFALPLEGLN